MSNELTKEVNVSDAKSIKYLGDNSIAQEHLSALVLSL